MYFLGIRVVYTGWREAQPVYRPRIRVLLPHIWPQLRLLRLCWWVGRARNQADLQVRSGASVRRTGQEFALISLSRSS